MSYGQPPATQAGPLDGMYANTATPILVLFGVCCSGIAFILSLIAFLTAKNPVAKSKAQLTLIVSVVVVILAVGAQVAMMVLGAAMGGR